MPQQRGDGTHTRGRCGMAGAIVGPLQRPSAPYCRAGPARAVARTQAHPAGPGRPGGMHAGPPYLTWMVYCNVKAPPLTHGPLTPQSLLTRHEVDGLNEQVPLQVSTFPQLAPGLAPQVSGAPLHVPEPQSAFEWQNLSGLLLQVPAGQSKFEAQKVVVVIEHRLQSLAVRHGPAGTPLPEHWPGQSASETHSLFVVTEQVPPSPAEVTVHVVGP